MKACSDFGEHAYAQQIWAWAFRSAAARNALRQKPVVVDGVGKPKLLSPDAAAFTAGIAAFSESGDWEVAKNILFEAERLADDAFTEAPRAQASSAQNKKTKSHESKNQKMRRLRSLQPSVGAYRAVSALLCLSPPLHLSTKPNGMKHRGNDWIVDFNGVQKSRPSIGSLQAPEATKPTISAFYIFTPRLGMLCNRNV